MKPVLTGPGEVPVQMFGFSGAGWCWFWAVLVLGGAGSGRCWFWVVLVLDGAGSEQAFFIRPFSVSVAAPGRPAVNHH